MIFKECPKCRHAWPDRNSFLADKFVRLAGYQANFMSLETGLFIFNHLANNCNTSMGIHAETFKDLYDGPIFTERITNTAKCPGYCKDKLSLNPCVNKCECAYVRAIIQIIRNWPKTGPQTEP